MNASQRFPEFAKDLTEKAQKATTEDLTFALNQGKKDTRQAEYTLEKAEQGNYQAGNARFFWAQAKDTLEMNELFCSTLEKELATR